MTGPGLGTLAAKATEWRSIRVGQPVPRCRSQGCENLGLVRLDGYPILSDPTHRVRFVYTPKHCSWLNQVEGWFSILVRRLLRRSSFRSLDDLRSRVLKFIDYFNAVLAKPFKWTYTGRPA